MAAFFASGNCLPVVIWHYAGFCERVWEEFEVLID